MLALVPLVLTSCVRMEGDLANECIDHADNDRDGLYDCDDPDCFGSPDCAGDDDTATDDDDAPTAADTTEADDDDTKPGDDDTTGDDDTAVDVSLSGDIDLLLTSEVWMLETPCEGGITGVLDASRTSLVGSGACVIDDGWGWGEYSVPLEFTCDVGDGSIDGGGTLYLTDISDEFFDDTTFAVAGSIDDDSLGVAATVSNVGGAGTDDVLITGTLILTAN